MLKEATPQARWTVYQTLGVRLVAPPDPVRLAAWLARTQLDGPGWPEIRLAEFRDALGERGLPELARLMEERRATDDPTRGRSS